MLGIPDFTEVNMHIGGIDELYAPEFRNKDLVRFLIISLIPKP